MAVHQLLIVAFFFFSLITKTTTTTTTTNLNTATSTEKASIASIVSAIEAGGGPYHEWARRLNDADISLLPDSATFFIPRDETFCSSPASASGFNYYRSALFRYQIISRRLSYSQLLDLAVGSELPTLLPGNTLLITNNSATNFSINGVVISDPDVFVGASVAAHGFSSPFPLVPATRLHHLGSTETDTDTDMGTERIRNTLVFKTEDTDTAKQIL